MRHFYLGVVGLFSLVSCDSTDSVNVGGEPQLGPCLVAAARKGELFRELQSDGGAARKLLVVASRPHQLDGLVLAGRQTEGVIRCRRKQDCLIVRRFSQMGPMAVLDLKYDSTGFFAEHVVSQEAGACVVEAYRVGLE